MRRAKLQLAFGIVCILTIPALFGCAGRAEQASGVASAPEPEFVDDVTAFHDSHESTTEQAVLAEPSSTNPDPEAVQSEDVSQADGSAEDDEFYDPFAEEGSEEAGEFVEYDPLEPYNVVVFKFNYNLDKYLVKPIAQGYNFIVPDAVQRGISNMFTNIRFFPRMLNNAFQGKWKGAGIELSSFVINSTVGIGGLFDPAENWLGLDTPVEDFGQTLGVYGVGPGPYLLLPLWPTPLTVRDGVGFVADIFLDPFNWLVLPLFRIDGLPVLAENRDAAFFANITLRVFDTLNRRSLNLETFQDVEEATVDLYGAVRNGYLQRRARDIQE